MAKNTICLWYDKDAEAAARFYCEIFPDSRVSAVHRAPGDYPAGKEGDVLTVDFTVAGIPCIGLNGGPAFKHNEAFSFQIATDDQEETDRYWNAIVGMNPMDLKRGIDLGVAAVLAEIKVRATKVISSSEIAQVGTIAANGDASVGEMIARAMEKVGNEGVITVEEARTADTELDVVEGMRRGMREENRTHFSYPL